MHTRQPSGSVLALRILVVCRRLVPSALFLHMLHLVGRVGCAAPQRACFVSSFGRFAPCDLGRSRSVPPGDSVASAILQRRLPRTRAVLAVSCSLQASFPNGLLASSPAGSEAGQRGVRMDGGADYVLDENSVHIWMVQTDHIEGRGEAFLETLQATLSEDEKQRYARSLATPRAREQALSFLVARALLRCTLSRYCPHVAPSCWRFEVNSYGRPSLSSQLQKELSRDKDNAALQTILQRLTKLRFNLSHCAGMVVCAFAYGREVGIDSENINGRRRIKSIAKRFFTPSETAALLSVPEEAQPLTFSRLWTLKEAYVKARGLGISGVGLDNFEFQLIDRLSCHRPTGSLAADLSKAGDTAADWQFVVLDPPRGGEEGLAQTGRVTDGDGGDGHAKARVSGHATARHTVALATSCFAMPPAKVRPLPLPTPQCLVYVCVRVCGRLLAVPQAAISREILACAT